MAFLNKIFDARENPISESSRRLYTRNLVFLNGGEEVTKLDFLSDVKATMSKIKHLSPNTQKSYLIAICSVLKNGDNRQLYNSYFELLKNANGQLSVNTQKSQSQTENWESQKEIDEVRENLKKKVPKKMVLQADYDALLDYLLVSLYTLIAPRRNIDYALMFISTETSDTDKNYLDITANKFIFNNYKTAGTYKQVDIDIPKPLMDVIRQYLKNHLLRAKFKTKRHSVPFLLNADGTEFTSDKITKRFHKIFGKKISSSMLRNIFLTTKYAPLLKSLEQDVKSMGTSSSTAINNYIKTD